MIIIRQRNYSDDYMSFDKYLENKKSVYLSPLISLINEIFSKIYYSDVRDLMYNFNICDYEFYYKGKLTNRDRTKVKGKGCPIFSFDNEDNKNIFAFEPEEDCWYFYKDLEDSKPEVLKNFASLIDKIKVISDSSLSSSIKPKEKNKIKNLYKFAINKLKSINPKLYNPINTKGKENLEKIGIKFKGSFWDALISSEKLCKDSSSFSYDFYEGLTIIAWDKPNKGKYPIFALITPHKFSNNKFEYVYSVDKSGNWYFDSEDEKRHEKLGSWDNTLVHLQNQYDNGIDSNNPPVKRIHNKIMNLLKAVKP